MHSLNPIHIERHSKNFKLIGSDVQGFVNPQGSWSKGQEGKGQGKDFITLNKPWPFWVFQGFFRG
jgi:hypothetical protein